MVINVMKISKLLIVISMFLSVLATACTAEKEPVSSSAPVIEKQEEEKKTVTVSASLFMVGDALLHQPVENSVVQPDGSYAFTCLDRIGAIASDYDLRYYNQETILGGDYFGVQGYPRFNGMQAWGNYMTDQLGFNIVSLANNHSLDMDMEGLTNSVNYWKGKQDVLTSGTYLSQEDYDRIEVREVNGISYSFISYTYGMNGLYPPEGEEYAVACYKGSEDELLNKVSKAKEMADVVIVAMHWGDEYNTEPNEEEVTLAQQLSDVGADIIIGNHPHCIQPVEWLNDHKTICFYALGNCVSGQYDLSRIEMMAGLTINKTSEPDGKVEVRIDDVHCDLMYNYFDDLYFNNFNVVPFYQMSDDTYVANHEQVYEEYKQIVTARDSSITVGGFE